VSAREELIGAASNAWIDGPLDPENLVEAEKLVDAFAHELAERLHALRAIVPDAHKDQAWRDGYAKAVETAIAYIDPAKEGERG